jgi:hypothetical protein
MSTSNNNEPSEVDKKKGEAEKPADWPGYWKAIARSLIITIVFVTIFLGTVAIFTGKVAKANILPTDVTEFPLNPNVEPTITGNTPDIDINIFKKYDSIFSFTPTEIYSTKIHFNMDEINKSYLEEGFLKSLNDLKHDPNKVDKLGFFGLYLRDVLITMISWNNTVINTIYYYINEYLPDWLVLIGWPIFSSLIYGLTTLVNYFGTFVAHLVNYADWFASVDEDASQQSGKIQWKPEGGFNSPLYRIGGLILYFFFFFFALAFFPIIVTAYTVLSPATIPATYSKDNKQMSFSEFVKSTIKNNMTPIMLAFSYNLLVDTKNFLGNVYASSVLIAIIVSALFLHLYSKSIDPESNPLLTPLVTSNNNSNTNTLKTIPLSQKNTPVLNPISSSTIRQVTPPSQRNTPVINPISSNTIRQVTPPLTPEVNPVSSSTIKQVTPNLEPSIPVSNNTSRQVTSNLEPSIPVNNNTNTQVNKETINSQQGGKKIKNKK